MECGVEVTHGHQKGVDGTSIFQVTHQVDVEVVKGTLGLVDTVKVKHTLWGVLVGTVARVDNGHIGNFRSILCSAFNIMAHNDNVCVVGNHRNGIFQRFAFCTTGNLRICETDDACSESVGCCFKTKSGAGGRFKEECSHNLSFE